MILTAAIAVTACDDSAKTFGRSYDECILKNAREGGEQNSRDMAMQVCQRRFERDPTQTERDRNIANGGTITPAPDFMPDAGDDEMRVNVINPFDDVLIVGVTIAMDFYDKPLNDVGERPADAKRIDTLTWDYPVALAPRQNDVLMGTFNGGKAPSAYYSVTVRTTKVVPVG